LLEPASISPYYYYPFGSTSSSNLCNAWNNDNTALFSLPMAVAPGMHTTLFYDQEPLLKDSLFFGYYPELELNHTCKLLANSEHSLLKQNLCKKENFLDWYYFYHGFASLFWFNDYQYLSDVEQQFTKVFISLNRLHTNHRSYRLNLVNEYIKREIESKGTISLPLTNREYGSWIEELQDINTLLPKNRLEEIHRNLCKYPGGFTADITDPKGFLSADCGQTSLHLLKSAFIHVVSESIFYHDKLHLTEKIFKPISIKRPFLLVGAPGNLQYLKSYGFQTFDKWIDETYDAEQDHDKRIIKVVNQLEKLCKLKNSELKEMHYEMRFVLEHNFNHFFNDFRTIITDELLENFKTCIRIYNNGRTNDYCVNINNINLDQVRKILLR
jgi:hypothetical protein